RDRRVLRDDRRPGARSPPDPLGLRLSREGAEAPGGGAHQRAVTRVRPQGDTRGGDGRHRVRSLLPRALPGRGSPAGGAVRRRESRRHDPPASDGSQRRGRARERAARPAAASARRGAGRRWAAGARGRREGGLRRGISDRGHATRGSVWMSAPVGRYVTGMRFAALMLVCAVALPAGAASDPASPGSLAIGVTTVDVVDASRNRTLVTEVWYPPRMRASRPGVRACAADAVRSCWWCTGTVARARTTP